MKSKILENEKFGHQAHGSESDAVAHETGSRGTSSMSASVDDVLDVNARLHKLATWRDEWRRQDIALIGRLAAVDQSRHQEQQLGWQISSLRRRMRMQLVHEPIEISPTMLEKIGGLTALQDHLRGQYVRLTKQDRQLWLNNLLFLMTPDLRRLNDKIESVRAYRGFGQARNFLLAGVSGAGKTTYLNWYTFRHLPSVEGNRNYVPVVKADAPVSNRTAKTLYERLLMEFGAGYSAKDSEADLLLRLILYIQTCGVEVIVIDEIEHIKQAELRRRLLEMSNLANGVPIVCASCTPERWVEGDSEVAGRWNDRYELGQYTGRKLAGLLTFVDTLLPFNYPSNLAEGLLKEERPKGRRRYEGNSIGMVIEDLTGGVLRDIMILIADSSMQAIEAEKSCLTVDIVRSTWRAIQEKQVSNPLDFLQQKRDS